MIWLSLSKHCLAIFHVTLVMATANPLTAQAQPFEFMRIGDQDGFGFTTARSLIRATPPPIIARLTPTVMASSDKMNICPT